MVNSLGMIHIRSDDELSSLTMQPNLLIWTLAFQQPIAVRFQSYSVFSSRIHEKCSTMSKSCCFSIRFQLGKERIIRWVPPDEIWFFLLLLIICLPYVLMVRCVTLLALSKERKVQEMSMNKVNSLTDCSARFLLGSIDLFETEWIDDVWRPLAKLVRTGETILKSNERPNRQPASTHSLFRLFIKSISNSSCSLCVSMSNVWSSSKCCALSGDLNLYALRVGNLSKWYLPDL